MRDIKSLGPGAPIRAAYEISKRAGTHTLIFGRRSKDPSVELVAAFQVPTSIPEAARRRAMEAAAKVVSGKVRLFGRSIEVGREPDWHHAVERGARWPLDDWWTIDIRSEHRLADVKWVWELGRMHHVVILARAAWLDPAASDFRTALNNHLRSWIEQNPPEKGVHWYSNLEIAIRCIAWLQIVSLVGGSLESAVRRELARSIYRSGHHLLADLPYTLSTMRNNHLLGDALGLIAIGKSFPGDRAADRWVRIGERIFHKQLLRHFRPDGSTIEDSLSYHRFVLDMLATRVLLGDASDSTLQALRNGARFLARLGVFDGSVPQYGDWDEGRLLTTAGSPHDFRGITWLGSVLSEGGAPPEAGAECDEVAWYALDQRPAEQAKAESDGRDIGGGIARAVRGPFHVWLKAGSALSHGHADLTSVAIRLGSQWLVDDPGTGTYNGPLEMRNYFRSSLAHNVLRMDGDDQLGPHRVFRWQRTCRAKAGPPIEVGGQVVMWGVHDAYTHSDPPTRVARLVVVAHDSITVSDWVENPAGRSYRLSLPLHPQLTWQDGSLTLDDGSKVHLDLPHQPRVTHGNERPYDGWSSETYGHTVPATRLEVEGPLTGPVVWSLRTLDAASQQLGIDVRWAAETIELVVRGEGELRSSIGWP